MYTHADQNLGNINCVMSKRFWKSYDTEIILLDQLEEDEPLLLLVQQVTGFNECNKNGLNIESVEKIEDPAWQILTDDEIIESDLQLLKKMI